LELGQDSLLEIASNTTRQELARQLLLLLCVVDLSNYRMPVWYVLGSGVDCPQEAANRFPLILLTHGILINPIRKDRLFSSVHRRIA